MYALQANDNAFTATTVKEIKSFFGLHILTGCLRFPRLRMYWDRSLKVDIFPETMGINRFFKLRTNLHCVNNLEQNDPSDKLWKVRPIYNSLLKRCKELTVETNVCVDEQMVPFKGKFSIKQYVKAKPHPWGIKLFLLCGRSGITYNFMIYQGKTTEYNQDLVKKYGQGATIVLSLSKDLEKGKHYLYCDNYFTSYNLIELLNQKSIFIAGTVRINRFSNPPLSKDSDFRKKQRGSSEEVVSQNGVVMVKWLDNRSVVLASNFVGIGDEDRAKRWDKNTKTYIEISRPEIVARYNTSMGGVDKADSLIALYRTKIRSRKWTLRMIFHAVDMTITNSWLEYKEDMRRQQAPPRKLLDLLHFRMQIGESLIKVESTPSRKRGRPREESSDYLTPKRDCLTEVRPLREVQLDMVNHLPIHSEKSLPGRCKKPGCPGKSRWLCQKCKVHLCLQKDKNCFLDFHNT